MKDARDELAAGEYLMSGGFWKPACFHAQQAVETALKARLLGKGWELEKVHSIARLKALCIDYKARVALNEEDFSALEPSFRECQQMLQSFSRKRWRG